MRAYKKKIGTDQPAGAPVEKIVPKKRPASTSAPKSSKSHSVEKVQPKKGAKAEKKTKAAAAPAKSKKGGAKANH